MPLSRTFQIKQVEKFLHCRLWGTLFLQYIVTLVVLLTDELRRKLMGTAKHVKLSYFLALVLAILQRAGPHNHGQGTVGLNLEKLPRRARYHVFLVILLLNLYYSAIVRI